MRTYESKYIDIIAEEVRSREVATQENLEAYMCTIFRTAITDVSQARIYR